MHHWQVVAGPMAALQAYFRDLGWDCQDMYEWTRPSNQVLPSAVLYLKHAWPVLSRALKREMRLQRVNKIHQQLFCDEISGQLDWSIYKQCLKTMAQGEQTALKAWTKGSLRTHTQGQQVRCPL